MPANEYPPRRESELVPYSANFRTKITTLTTAVGLTAAQATSYGTKHDDFVTKWNVCQNPATKTRMAVATKNASKSLLVAEFRVLARVAQNFPGTTDALRIDLGLPVRDVVPSPINPPTEPPVMEVVRVDGRRVTIRLRAVGSESRGKPDGVWGASVLSYIGVGGATPPADLAAWKTEGESTRTDFDVEFATTVPAGSQVWLTAFWKNPRLIAGPACDPVNVYLGGGVALAA